jgi:hypothetical protein
MFKAIKEFFFGKPVVDVKVDAKVEAANSAPYKVPEPAAVTPAPVAVSAKTESAKKPAKIAASKKPAAPKKPAGAKKGGRKPKA